MKQSSKNNSLKIYVLAPNEDWIVDRFVQEWNEYSGLAVCNNPKEADIIWLLADWSWKNLLSQISFEELKQKNVVTTVHHIVPEKFGVTEQYDFAVRDIVTDYYHVYNEHTQQFISKFTNKPIKLIKYWANDKFWKLDKTITDTREELHLDQKAFIVGSFQRDTEGHDLVTPKLEKGPDLFCDYVERIVDEHPNLHVLLGGWRRQYVINRLNEASIPFTYFERPPLDTVRKMYRSLDLYVVSARCEGGPQALIEAGLMSVPCVSRDIGIASQVLPAGAVKDNLISATPSIPNIQEIYIHKIMPSYVKFFEEIKNKRGQQ